MKKIPLEILFRLDEKITNLPNNGSLRRQLIQETADRYHISESSVYRQLNDLNIHPKERKTRLDKGVPRVIPEEDLLKYCQLVAAMKIRSMNSQKHVISTEKCIKLLEEGELRIKGNQITLPKGVLKVSTVNKYLNHYLISLKDLINEPTVNHFEAAYSNQCWQFDITPSELHRLPSQHKDDPRRLFVFSVVDDKSGLSFSRYYLAEGEDTLTALDFLYNAFAKITEAKPELYGLPDFIYTDNAAFIKSRLFMRVMSKLGIQILSHLPKGKGGRKTTSRAKGKAERHHRSIKSMIEPIYQLQVPRDLNEANQHLAVFMEEIAHKKHRSQSKSRHQVWINNLPKHADTSICSYEQYTHLLREPIERVVKSDATIQLNGVHYQLSPQFAGEKVVALLSSTTNEIDIEYNDQDYGPFRPMEAPTIFGNYNHHQKSEKEAAADNVVEISKHISLDAKNKSMSHESIPLNINGQIFSGRMKLYSSSIEAKLALAKHLGKPLSLLPDAQRQFIDTLIEQTLDHHELIKQLNNYMALKLATEKE